MSRLFVPSKSPILDPQMMDDSYVRKSPRSGLRDLSLPSIWQAFFRSVQQLLEQAPIQNALVEPGTTLAAAIATTIIPTNPLAVGLYRANYYLRITQPADISSAVELVLTWTDGGVSCSWSSGPLSGNTTHSVVQGSTIINVDDQTQISYATAYASVGATDAQYTLVISLESMP